MTTARPANARPGRASHRSEGLPSAADCAIVTVIAATPGTRRRPVVGQAGSAGGAGAARTGNPPQP